MPTGGEKTDKGNDEEPSLAELVKLIKNLSEQVQELKVKKSGPAEPSSVSAPSTSSTERTENKPGGTIEKVVTEEFPLTKAPEFSHANPGDATRWVKLMTLYLQMWSPSETSWVDYAGMSLPPKVQEWYLQYRSENVTTIWEDFVQALLKRYEPVNIQDKAAYEYYRLEQTGTVREYYNRTLELLEHMPNLTEDVKVDRFITGLKPMNREHVLEQFRNREQRTLFSVASLAIEKEENRFRFNDKKVKYRSQGGYKNKHYIKNYKDRSKGGTSSPSNVEAPKKGVCHICKEPGHWARECPEERRKIVLLPRHLQQKQQKR